MRSAADVVLAYAWGATCAACGVPLGSPTRGPVCTACWSAVHALGDDVCARCGLPLNSWTSDGEMHVDLCGPCAAGDGRANPGTPAIAVCRAYGRYDGSLRRIIHAFKYHGHRSLALPLAAGMKIAGRDVLRDADLVVPVPLHVAKHASRGFNQARDLAVHLGVPCVPALARRRATVPQAGLDARGRRANVRNAFAPSALLKLGARLCGGPGSVAGRTVVLVDDVRTTGATLEACARVLKAWGAREVRALTAAAVVRE